jgi:acyl-CoA thioesterase-1
MQFRFKNFTGSSRIGRLLALLVLMLSASCAYSASKTVLVLGDSLSAEYGLARGSGWVALLQSRLQAEKIDEVVVNASISGETTSGGKARLPALLQQYHPAVVVIELGANDGLRGLALSANEANQRSMIELAKLAKAKVILLGMRLPPNYGGDYAQQFFSLYSKLSREAHVALVPFFLEGLADQPQLFQPDRLHPTVEAQAAILDNVWPYLKPLLKN